MQKHFKIAAAFWKFQIYINNPYGRLSPWCKWNESREQRRNLARWSWLWTWMHCGFWVWSLPVQVAGQSARHIPGGGSADQAQRVATACECPHVELGLSFPYLPISHHVPFWGMLCAASVLWITRGPPSRHKTSKPHCLTLFPTD